jgi:hypothetical protein
VAIGAAALGAVIFAVALALYIRYIRYDRVAGLHIPHGASVVVRLDVEQALLYEPVRRHLLPILGAPRASSSQGDARLARIEDRTGLHRGDLREVVVASFADSSDWVIVLGGIFPRGPSAQTIALAFASEGAAWDLSSDGRVAMGPEGVAVTRASDGAVIIGSSEGTMEAALPSRDPILPVTRTGPGGFAFDTRGVADLQRRLSDAPGVATLLSHTTELRGTVSLSESVAVTVTADVAAGSNGTQLLGEALAWLRTYAKTEASPGAGLIRAGVERSVVSPAGGAGAQGAQVTMAWEREEVDRGFALASAAIRDALGGAPGAAVQSPSP